MDNDIRSRVREAVAGTMASFEIIECDPDLADTAAFCATYDVPLDRTANTIVLASKRPAGLYAAFVVLATTRLDVNGVARRLMDARKVSFASASAIDSVTGMITGGVTPFGIPDDVPVFIDSEVLNSPWVVLGGGTRDWKLKIDPSVFLSMPSCTVVEGLATAIEPS